MNTTTVPLREYNARALHGEFCQSMANPRCSNLPHRPFDYDVEVLGRLMQRDELLAALEALLRNATDKARYIAHLESPERDIEAASLPDEALDSPEMKQARAALAAARTA